MAEVFVSLQEAAELESMTYKGFTSRLQRKPDEFITQTKSGDRGKDKVFVALSSLSSKARKQYKERLKVEEEVQVSDEVPWYVDCDVEWYIEKHKKEYYKAVELASKIKEYEDSVLHGYKAEAIAAISKELGIGKRTFQRYVQDYHNAGAWASQVEKYTGENYDFFPILALCRKPRESNTFPSLDFQTRTYIENIWFNKAFAQNRGTIEMLYSKLGEIAEEKGFDIPSYMTVYRYIQYLMNEKRAKNAQFLAANGLREYKNKVMVKGSRDVKALQVLEVVQGDEHTFDCWVEYTNSNGKKVAIRPKLVAWIDMRSRVILGDVICKDANAQILKQSVYKMIYDDEFGGVCKYLLIDNGKDYTAKEMTGRNRKDRYSPLSFDSETRGFYKSLGIIDEHRSMPYETWTKGNIERFFGSVEKDFTRWITSYTGTLTGSKTTSKVKKDVRKLQEQGKLLTMEEFYEKWTVWLKEQYHNAEHSALKKAKEKWTTPAELFRNCEEKYFRAAPPKSYARMIMMKAERVHVYNIGIKRFGYEYRADELVDYINDKVDIRYDNNDVTKIYVYNRSGKFICEAVSQELLQIAPIVSQKVLEEHIKAQKAQIKRDRERLEQYQMPIEERIANYENATVEAIGVDNMMIEGKGKENKVVSLPIDKQYKEKITRDKEQKETTQSDYLQRQADKALEKLRTLG